MQDAGPARPSCAGRGGNIAVYTAAAAVALLSLFMAVYLKEPDSDAEQTIAYARGASLYVSELRGARETSVRRLAPRWSGIYWISGDPASREIIISAVERRPGGGKRVRTRMGIWALDADSSSRRLLHRGLVGRPLAHDTRAGLLYFVAYGGDLEGYFAAEDAREWHGRVLRLDLATGESAEIPAIGGDVDPLSLRISPQGRHISLKKKGEPGVFRVYDTKTGTLDDIALEHPQAYLQSRFGYFSALHRVARPGKPPRFSWETESWPAPRESITPYVLAGGGSPVYADVDGRMVRAHAAGAPAEILGDGCVYPRLLSPDGRTIACLDTRSAPLRPAVFDLETGEATTIYASPMPLDPFLMWGEGGDSLLMHRRSLLRSSMRISAGFLAGDALLIAFMDERRVFPVVPSRRTKRRRFPSWRRDPIIREPWLPVALLEVQASSRGEITMGASLGRRADPQE